MATRRRKRKSLSRDLASLDVSSDSDNNQRKLRPRKQTEKSVSDLSTSDLAYDGDSENTVNNSSSQSCESSLENKTDEYTFNEPDTEFTRKVLSTKQLQKNKRKLPTQTHNVKKSKTVKCKTGKVKEESVLQRETPHLARKHKQSSVLRQKEPLPKRIAKRTFSPESSSDAGRTSKRRKKDEKVCDSGSSKRKREKSDSSSLTESFGDSGIFISPILKPHDSTASTKDTSTPASVVEKERAAPNVCFDSRDFHSPPLISPVQRVLTPFSDYDSSAYTVSSLSLEEEQGEVKGQKSEPQFKEPDIIVNRSSSLIYKPSKKKRGKGRYSTNRVNAWADLMNSEFEEIEKFELSIEG